MASLYIHIPFCKKACHYCSFYFVVSTSQKTNFIEALFKEIELKSHFIKTPIQTLFFGGGTPSLFSEKELEAILKQLHRFFDLSQMKELSIECNPDDINIEKLQSFQTLGFNRISIGIQSFIEEELIEMNRSHNVFQAQNAIENALHYFENVSIDLMFNLPSQSIENWQYNLETALSFPIKHISTYNLTIEEKTALQRKIQNGTLQAPPENYSALMYEYTMRRLSDTMHHYEISNFAVPGFESIHNQNYWFGKDYIGFGPSAHSFLDKKRHYNISNLNQYINNLKEDNICWERETLTLNNQWNEFVLTRLRTYKGIEIQEIEHEFGIEYKQEFIKNIQPFIDSDDVCIKQNAWILTDKGKLFADRISSDLMIVD
jgi:oxygen-independent coproporphyrinogen-3 oxidase